MTDLRCFGGVRANKLCYTRNNVLRAVVRWRYFNSFLSHLFVASNMAVDVVVFGSGSFGTALGTVLARNGHNVTILARNAAVIDAINMQKRNPRCFPDMELPQTLKAAQSGDVDQVREVMKSAKLFVHTVPVQYSFEYLQTMAPFFPEDAILCVCSKGLHVQRREFMIDLAPAALEAGGRRNTSVRLAAFSGPTFAKELMLGFPTGAVVAAEDISLAREVSAYFSQPTLRTFLSTDLIGVEVSGALKNVYAIAAGAAEGIGLGANTTALLVTRAVAEMNILATALGSTEPTLAGLAGIGDLMLTCFGGASRNRTVGVRLGKGETLQEIMASMAEVAEGVATAPAALALAESKGLGSRVPIIKAINDVLQGQATVQGALSDLLTIPVGREHMLDGVELGGSGASRKARGSPSGSPKEESGSQPGQA